MRNNNLSLRVWMKAGVLVLEAPTSGSMADTDCRLVNALSTSMRFDCCTPYAIQSCLHGWLRKSGVGERVSSRECCSTDVIIGFDDKLLQVQLQN